MLMDPLIVKIISVGLGIMLLVAAYHKLSDLQKFRAILSEYQLVPVSLLSLVSFILPSLELALGTAWLLGFGFGGLVVICTSLVLFVYGVAMAINIRRGRVFIDCGCSLGGSSNDAQFLSVGHVVRNALLIAAALLTLIPVTDRQFGFSDFLLLVITILSCTLLFGAAKQLTVNRAAINVWRKVND